MGKTGRLKTKKGREYILKLKYISFLQSDPIERKGSHDRDLEGADKGKRREKK